MNWQALLEAPLLQQLLEAGPHAEGPLAERWGYYLGFEGIGYFSWFDSQAEMLQHLVHVEMWHAPLMLSTRQAYIDKVQRLLPAAESFANNGQSAELIRIFNQEIGGVSLRWLGPLAGLENDSSEFAQALCRRFEAAHPLQKCLDNPTACEQFLDSYEP